MMRPQIYSYFFIACLSATFLSGCESSISANTTKKETESERLRKNGNALIEIGNAEAAVNEFDKLIKLEPKNIVAYNGKAVAFDRGGNHLAAQEIYKTALSINPNSVLTKSNLAMSFILSNRLKKAVGILEPLAKGDKYKKSPYLETIKHNLALSYALMEQPKKAKALNLTVISKKEAEAEVNAYKNPDKKAAKDSDSDRNTGKKTDVSLTTTSNPPPVKPKSPAVAVAEKAKESTKKNSSEKQSNKSTFLGITTVYSYPE